MKWTWIKLLAAASACFACLGAVGTAAAQVGYYYRPDVSRADQLSARLLNLQYQYQVEVANGQYFTAQRTAARIAQLQHRLLGERRLGRTYYRP